MPQLIQRSRPTFWTPFGNTHWAASCEYNDVVAAIALADPGDTVYVPDGAATWGGQLLITKGILLLTESYLGTVITSGWNTTGANDGLIKYQPANPALDEPFRLAGFELNGNGDGVINAWSDPAGYSQLLTIRNTSNTAFITKIRIDHNKFVNCDKSNWVSIQGHIAGVGDNNIFYDTGRVGSYSAWPTIVFHDAMHAATWTNMTFQYGSSQQFYWEDNTIISSGMIVMSYYGARWAMRHNTITWPATFAPAPMFDAHGNKSGTGMNGVMGLEIYDNTIIFTYPPTSARLIDHRGGMGLFYNNLSTGTTKMDIYCREEVFDSEAPPATGPDGQPQYCSSTYCWNNADSVGNLGLQQIASQLDYGGSIGLAPAENEEIWFHKVSFDGSVGVGVGLLSARPSSGLTVGVGYWATDTNTLYRATGATTWEVYYTPHTYPHPHRSDTILGD